MHQHDSGGLSRRTFLATAAAFSAALTWPFGAIPALAQTKPDQKEASMPGNEKPFAMPALPYAEDALEPYISSKTLSFHYGKHHRGYLETLNKLADNTPLAAKSLVDVIRDTYQKSDQQKVFNNSAQVWNHDFYWHSMAKGAGGKPTGKIARLVDDSFGSYDKFKDEYIQKGMDQFGSGYVWLVQGTDGKLAIMNTPNAVTPVAMPGKPLLTTDVWEHAYYLDYQNRRKDYLAAVVEHLLNWPFAEKNLG